MGTDISKIVVVGAGVAGCHTARNLATDHEVVVLDESGVAAGATGLSAGVVAPTLFYGEFPDIARYGNEFFRRFDGTHGFEFRRRARIDVVTEEEVPTAREKAETLSEAEFPVSFLDTDALTDRYPQFDVSQFAGAAVYEDTGWVDPYTYTTALRQTAADSGAVFEMGVSVDRVVTKSGTVIGVRTSDGFVSADAVVLAAGWRTSELLPPECKVPIRPYRTQVCTLEPTVPLDDAFPIGRIGSKHYYFRPEENGNLLVGGGHHTVEDPVAASSDVDESFRIDVAEFVPSFINGFTKARFVSGWAGVDAATPDTRPLIGTPPGGPDDLVVTTGFNGLGIMASPIVGSTVRQRLTGESAPFTTAPFAADRFENVATKFDHISTSEI